MMANVGHKVDDLDAHYLMTHRVAMFWRYDDKARCAGEYVYDDLNSYQVERMHPDNVVTQSMAADIIAGLLETRTLDVL